MTINPTLHAFSAIESELYLIVKQFTELYNQSIPLEETKDLEPLYSKIQDIIPKLTNIIEHANRVYPSIQDNQVKREMIEALNKAKEQLIELDFYNSKLEEKLAVPTSGTRYSR